MSKLCKKLPILLLALSVLCMPCAAAAQYTLRAQMDAQGKASLELGGIAYSVYALQLELTLPGQYQAVTYTPSVAGAYSPGARVTADGAQTRVTIYLDSQAPMNEGDTLAVGVLSAERALKLPDTGKLTLLGRDLKPLADANGTTVTLSGDLGNSNTSDSSDDGSNTQETTYGVSVSTAAGGTVTASPGNARPGATVKLTVKPKQGYQLDTLQVKTKSGQTVQATRHDDGTYSFVMPGAAVKIEAVFIPVDETHAASLPFGDVAQDDWFHDAVRFVYAQGMMSGTDKDTFSPGEKTTRGMLVTVLYRLEGSPEAGASRFTDVPASMYYAGSVAWAAEHGMVSGYGNGRFGADDLITREQLASILFRYAQYKGYDTAGVGELSAFADASAVSPYADEAVRWAVGSGLIGGKGGGILDPGAGATRAEMAAVLMRFCEQLSA